MDLRRPRVHVVEGDDALRNVLVAGVFVELAELFVLRDYAGVQGVGSGPDVDIVGAIGSHQIGSVDRIEAESLELRDDFSGDVYVADKVQPLRSEKLAVVLQELAGVEEASPEVGFGEFGMVLDDFFM